MALWRRLADFLWKAPVDRSEEAFRKTDEVVAEARELSRRLEPYTREKDPLTALMVDIYNRREEVAWRRAHQVNVR